MTALPGTTRDVLDEKLSIGGVPVRLIDTAGIREAENEAERIGVARARAEIPKADVLLVMLDASEPLLPADEALLCETAGQTRIVLANKCDLPLRMSCGAAYLSVSARTGEGLDALRAQILSLAAPERADGGMLTNERHLHALEQAEKALDSALCAGALDLAATDIRDALHFLGTITGTDVDADVIDRIFARFCIGK